MTDAPPSAAPASGAAESDADPAAPDAFRWDEKSLTVWANERLGALLRRYELEIPGGSMFVTELAELKGDAFSTMRRGRKGVFFEFSCKAKWEGELFDKDGNVVGTGDGDLEVIEFDQDTDMSKVDVKVEACSDGNHHDARLAALLRRFGIPDLRRVLTRFVAELKEQ